MSDDPNYEEISTKVECVKIGMRHTKDGHIISFAINPHDTPQSLMTDPLGQRYLAVLVRLNDQDEPVASQEDEDGRKAVALAGTLCGDDKFQTWLAMINEINDATEEAASVWLRRELGVASRKELKNNLGARKKLAAIRDEFVAALRSGSLR